MTTGNVETTLGDSGLQQGRQNSRLICVIRRVPVEMVVFIIAVMGRLIPLMRLGSFNGEYGYDAGVYYAGSSALLHGRMPYRDFVLLHPPGILLADFPFAALGRLTSDHIGFSAAVLASTAVGGMNAVLVMRIARRLGLDRAAVIAGGLVYALWFGSIAAEYLPRLEPLGNLMILTGVLALVASRQGVERLHRTTLPLLSGAAFAAALSVKVWWAVPLAVVFTWMLVVHRAYRTVLLGVGGAVLGALVIDGPFLLAARSAMPRMVVSDQLGRVANNPHSLRVASYIAIGSAGPSAPTKVALLAVALAGAALIILGARAWRVRAGRAAVVLLAVQLIQIMLQPSWFTFYADFLTVPLALTIAGGLSSRPGPDSVPAPRARSLRGLVVPVAVGLVGAALLPYGLSPRLLTPFPRRTLTAALAGKRCIQTDYPLALIQTNTLTRVLNNRCVLWVDVTGKLYDVDRPNGNPRYTKSYTAWQTDVTRYLLSGDAIMLVRRPRSIRILAKTETEIESGGLITSSGYYRVYHPPRG